jgi:hypothetical protein
VRAELFFQRVQFGGGGQMAVEQQVDDLFEARVGCEIVDIVSAVGKTAFSALDVTEQGAADDDALKAAVDDDTGG